MAFFNYVTREITLKVVYYGPGLSGKTTNLQYLYSVLDASSRGKFISLATESDRTLFFDFLPVELGKIKDFSVRFQLYTVPGQIRYNATRKLVLKGADAIVFVADSQRDMREQNTESFENMKENLVANNLDMNDISLVLQYNKRDLTEILTVGELNADLNERGYQTIEAIAAQGKGVQETFRLVTSLLLKDIAKKHRVDVGSPKEEGVAVKVPEKERFEVAEEGEPQAAPAKREAPVVAALREEIFPSQELEVTGGAATPETVTTPFAAEPVPTLRKAEEASVRPRTVLPRTVAYSDERITAVLSMLREMNQSLGRLQEAVSALSKESRESGKQHAETTKMLRELTVSVAGKKSLWSRLFSR